MCKFDLAKTEACLENVRRNYRQMKTYILIFILLGLISCSDKTNQVEIIPGKGIVYNNDSIIIYKCSPIDLCKIFNIKDTFEIDYVDCEQYDANGNAMDVHVPYKIITIKELQFNFSGQTEDSLVLKRIFIKTTHPFYSLLLSKTILTDTSFSIIKQYPNSLDYEMTTGGDVGEITLNGITFAIDSVKKRILTINIHQKEK
jgi:hypothetical protein